MSTAWFKLRYGLYPYSTVFRTAVAVYGTVVSPRRMCYYDDGHCWLGEHLSPIFQLSVLSQQYCGRMNPDLSTMAFYIMTMNKIILFLIYFWQSWLFNNVSCRSTCTDIEDNGLPDVTGFVHTVQFQSIRQSRVTANFGWQWQWFFLDFSRFWRFVGQIKKVTW